MGTCYTLFVESPLGAGWHLEALFKMGKLYPSEFDLVAPQDADWMALRGCSPPVLEMSKMTATGFIYPLLDFIEVARDIYEPPQIQAFYKWGQCITRLVSARSVSAEFWRVVYLGI